MLHHQLIRMHVFSMQLWECSLLLNIKNNNHNQNQVAYWPIVTVTYSWLWSPTPSSQWFPTVLYQHNRRFSGGVPVWPRFCLRGRDDSSVWEWQSVDPRPGRFLLQPQIHTHINTNIHRGIYTHTKCYTRFHWTWWVSESVKMMSPCFSSYYNYIYTGIISLQDPVMKEAISLPHVPLVFLSQQLSPVLFHSSLEYWLVLWCTTVLWGRNVIARSSTLWQ